EGYKVRCVAAYRDVCIEFSEEHAACKNKLVALHTVTNAIAYYFTPETRGNFRRKIADLVCMCHYDVLRTRRLDDFGPRLGIAVGRIRSKLVVFGDDYSSKIVPGDLLGQRTIFITRDDRGYFQTKVLTNVLRRCYRLKRSLIKDAVLVFDKNEDHIA